MSVLRIILAGLLALAAIVAGLVAAAFVVVVGLIGYVAQRFWRPQPTAVPPVPSRPTRMSHADAIEVESTPVPPARPEI